MADISSVGAGGTGAQNPVQFVFPQAPQAQQEQEQKEIQFVFPKTNAEQAQKAQEEAQNQAHEKSIESNSQQIAAKQIEFLPRQQFGVFDGTGIIYSQLKDAFTGETIKTSPDMSYLFTHYLISNIGKRFAGKVDTEA